MDTAQTEQRAGDDCMRVADDYVAIGEHDVALTFVRQAQLHYERAAALRASEHEGGRSPAGSTEAA